MFRDHYMTRNGKKVAVPRYYRKKILEELGPVVKRYYEELNFIRHSDEEEKVVKEQFGGNWTKYVYTKFSDRDRRKAYFDRIEFEFRSKR